ncbi:MAG: DUF1080 domain-containing protein [Spirosomataceae bacterium]
MIKQGLIFSMMGIIALTNFFIPPQQKSIRIFDGKSFKGWEGDTLKMWRIENGAIIGGSLETKVPHNDFLCTQRSYSNFVLKLKFKLTGKEGFINSGVQFRSKRLTNPAYEMVGYQADLGDKYWASLYDESRRNKTLIAPDSLLIQKILKPNAWNDYEVSAINRNIRIKLNGKLTVDYTEADESIPQSGIIGLQIHGGGKAEVAFKDIAIQKLD